MSVLVLAGNEWQRFMRRGEGRLLVLVFCLVGTAPAAAAWLSEHALRAGYESAALGHELAQTIAGCSAVGRGLVLLLLAWILSSNSLRTELREGSWRLIQLAPVSSEVLLVGKALGVTACLLSLELAYLLGRLAVVPVLGRRTGSLLVESAVLLLLAVALVPDGLAGARVEQRGRWAYLALRTLQVARGFGFLLLIALADGHHLTPLGPVAPVLEGADPLACFATTPSDARVQGSLAAAQLLAGAFAWFVFVRPWRR